MSMTLELLPNVCLSKSDSSFEKTNKFLIFSDVDLITMKMSGAAADPKLPSKERKYLPLSYQLDSNDVYCGRGSLCFNHVGNLQFRSIVFANLQRYQTATAKFKKSEIIQEIVDFIRSRSPEGGFVKKDFSTNQYFEVGDFHAVSSNTQTCIPHLQRFNSNF
jgi:hypothetical protein